MLRNTRWFLIAAVVLAACTLSACKTKPPIPKLEYTPANGTLTAGETLEIRATKPMSHQSETFTYAWKLEGDCAGELPDPKNWKVAYTIPDDCAGGKLTVQLTSTTRHGTTNAATTFEVKAKEKEKIGVEPVWFEKRPATWEIVNDFEKPLPGEERMRRNTRDAYFGTWTYRDGKCKITNATEGDHKALEVEFTLPHTDNSACGYFDYLTGDATGAKLTDISGFDRFSFVAKSASGEPMKVRVELVEFDKYANYNQGIVGTSGTLVVDGQWRRHEIVLKKLAPNWDLASTKSVGFKIDSKDGNPKKGAILLEDLALVRAQ